MVAVRLSLVPGAAGGTSHSGAGTFVFGGGAMRGVDARARRRGRESWEWTPLRAAVVGSRRSVAQRACSCAGTRPLLLCRVIG